MDDLQAHLLQVLESHGTSLSSSDVSWAFSDPKTRDPVNEWIEQNLLPSTLLTLEEHTILAHLQKMGAYKKLQQSTPQDIIPKTEPELEAEIVDLEASTLQLRQQTAMLKAQTTALENSRSRQRAEKERRKTLDAERRKKWATEKEEALADVEDLVSILGEEMTDLEDTIGSDPEADVAEVTAILEQDDRVLARLERMAALLVVPDDSGGEMAEAMKRAEALVEKLRTLSERAIRARLDRIYLEALPQTEFEPDPKAENDINLAASELQQQIDSFYSEIPTVARGAGYTQYLKPLNTLLESARQSRGENWLIGGDYIDKVLAHLTSRNQEITSFLTCTRDRDLAILTLISTVTRESQPLTEDPDRNLPPHAKAPPSHAKTLLSRTKTPPSSPPPRLRPTNRSPLKTPRRADLALNKTEYPEFALLSHLGVSLPPPEPPATVPAIIPQLLDRQIMQQRTKIDTLTNAWENVVGEAWDGAHREVWEVVKALTNSYEGGEVVLRRNKGEGMMGRVERELREKVKEVEGGVREFTVSVGSAVRGVDELSRCRGDLGGKGAKGEFVERWGR